MYRKIWSHCQKAVCAVNFYSAKGIRFDSVTGFKYGKYLLTDEMVYKIDKASEVQIAFMDADGVGIKASVKITDKDFRMRMVKGIRDSYPGFALIDIDFPQFDDIPSLKLSNSNQVSVASPIAIIGHQMEHNNMAIKTGIVSSFLKQNGHKYIQFDAAIDRGNSGSPLINVETGEVIGIVGHRLASVNNGYKQIIDIINKNMTILKEAEGKINFNDIDPIQVLIANQNQMKRLAQEFFKTASLNYGLAVDINEVSEYFDIAELEKERDKEKVLVNIFREN
jgi:S1-C subfamily serine protease